MASHAGIYAFPKENAWVPKQESKDALLVGSLRDTICPVGTPWVPLDNPCVPLREYLGSRGHLWFPTSLIFALRMVI